MAYVVKLFLLFLPHIIYNHSTCDTFAASQLVFHMDKEFFFAVASVLPFFFTVSTVLQLDRFSWNFLAMLSHLLLCMSFLWWCLSILLKVKFLPVELLLTCIYL